MIVWSKKVKIEEGAEDPLGMDRFAEKIASILVYGINVLTFRARYYSFYTWAYNYLLNTRKILDDEEFVENMGHLEKAFAIGSFLHNKSTWCTHNLNGKTSIRKFDFNFIKEIDLDFKLMKNPLGGFGYYYGTTINQLDLVVNEGNRIVITKKGKEVAESYERSIIDTSYFRGYLNKKVIPIFVLSEYGNSCCLCELNSHAEERDQLISLFFNKINSPRTNLLFILNIIKEIQDKNIVLEDEDFRKVIYFKQISHNKSKEVIDLKLPELFQDRRFRWRIFQLHEYFAMCCESLFINFLNFIKNKPGTRLDAFIDEIISKDFYELLLKYTGKSIESIKNCDYEDFIQNILNKFGIEGKLDSKTSILFDNICNLKSELNEDVLENLMRTSINEKNKSSFNSALTFLMLTLLYIRFYHLRESKSDYWKWGSNLTKDSRTIFVFFEFVDMKLKIEDIVKLVFNEFIIKWHNKIVYDKFKSQGKYVIWFEESKGIYKFKKEHWLRHHDIRFNSCYSVLHDLGLTVEDDKKIVKLTPLGEKIIKNERNILN